MTHRAFFASLGFLGSLLALPAHAQVRGGGGFLPPASPAGTVSPGFGRPGLRALPPHRGHHHYRVYGPYFYPYYPYDYDDGSSEPPPPPQRYQPESAPAAAPAPPAKPAESMVVELRGDRWVRLTSSGPQEIAAAPARQSGSAIDSTAKALPAFNPSTPAAALPPATLVFRDGHQEQAAKYTIVGSIVYLKSDYWTTGSWTREISVSDLDIPATLKLNHDRGVAFSLPSRPSEIILRP